MNNESQNAPASVSLQARGWKRVPGSRTAWFREAPTEHLERMREIDQEKAERSLVGWLARLWQPLKAVLLRKRLD